MITTDAPIERLYGVGEKVKEKLNLLGLARVRDLLYYYPRRYEDYSHPRAIADVVPEQSNIIKGRILTIHNDVSAKRRIKLTHAQVADSSGTIAVTWFNQPFLQNLLKPGSEWLFAGKVERDYKGNLTLLSPEIEREPKILAVYNETAGLTSKLLRKLLFELKPLIVLLPDPLPEEIRLSQNLVPLSTALNYIHFPEKIEQLSLAKRRLAFEELFDLLLMVQQSRLLLGDQAAPSLNLTKEQVGQFTTQLPFALTDSQQMASQEILSDLAKTHPMNRLLEGDVGSGKTLVGLIAALAAIKSGYQAVWMAPTSILAYQHFATAQRFLGYDGSISVALLTGQTKQADRDRLNENQLIIGTQAAIQEKISFDKLGLVIVDEQHRFGVEQRAKLINQNSGQIPHLLAMTATPIPRSLALTVYGDLDISILHSVPTGRKPIISRLVDEQKRPEAYNFIRKQVALGRQVFVVCPLIVEPGATGQLNLEFAEQERRAAQTEYLKLQKQIFPELRVGLLHGKLKPKEKDQIMAQFKEQKIDILVSTAVIEVGIDIPNATVMMIESAERFGLAQLHQFRGRVGRGGEQSYCLVFSESDNPLALERLRAFVSTTSGFELAELDLSLRGPGQLAGLQQSGDIDLKLARLSDIDLIQEAKRAVAVVVENGLDNYPLLTEKIKSLRESKGMIVN